jgi:hypothetical protein
MKIRPGIWLILMMAASVVAIVLWHPHRGTPPAIVETHPQPALPTAAPMTQAVRSSVMVLPPVSPAARPAEASSATVKMIVDEGKGFDARTAAMHALSAPLADADLETIYNFLRQRSPADGQQAEQVLKNELLNVLCQMEPPPAGLRGLLSQIYQDSSQDIVLRDYAVQHLAAFYRQMGLATGLDPRFQDNELKQTQDVLWNALNEAGTSMAGTALLGLSQLSAEGWPGLDQNKIGAAALKLAGESSVDELSRITAFQVCAQLGITDALSSVLGAARQGETLPLQISAIAALGALGNASQIPFLNGLIAGNNDRLKLPAQHALRQINERLKLPVKSS